MKCVAAATAPVAGLGQLTLLTAMALLSAMSCLDASAAAAAAADVSGWLVVLGDSFQRLIWPLLLPLASRRRVGWWLSVHTSPGCVGRTCWNEADDSDTDRIEPSIKDSHASGDEAADAEEEVGAVIERQDKAAGAVSVVSGVLSEGSVLSMGQSLMLSSMPPEMSVAGVVGKKARA